MARLTPSQQRELLREATRAIRGGGRRAGGILRRLGARLGPLGELLGIVADIISGGRSPGRKEVQDAIEILQDQGFDIRPGGAGEPPVAPPVQPRRGVVPPVSVPRGPTKPPARPGRAQPAEVWPEEGTIETLPVRVRGAFESIPEDVEGFSPWILTPQSSNVHSVAWDASEGVLYICFRAEGKPIGYKDGISICSGKAYKIAIRPDVPGPVYSYGGAGRKVPESIFTAIATSNSPGKQVWDKLRVCGSNWQHKYVYSLVDAPGGSRIPRKATRRGLRVRHAPTVGLGRRGARRSTLPQRIR